MTQGAHGERALLPLQVLEISIPCHRVPLGLDLGGQYLAAKPVQFQALPEKEVQARHVHQRGPRLRGDLGDAQCGIGVTGGGRRTGQYLRHRVLEVVVLQVLVVLCRPASQ